MMNHAVFLLKWSQQIMVWLHKLFSFLWLRCVKERLTSSGESEPEESGPSCSWQDSGSFLCLNRKCEKSDFLVFHLHTHRIGASVFPVCFIACVIYWNILPSCLTLCLFHISHSHHTLIHKQRSGQLTPRSSKMSELGPTIPLFG